jgi:multisubunit Na+/H+ antiporter MnhB subunit
MSDQSKNIRAAGILASIILLLSFLYILSSLQFPHTNYFSMDPRGRINLDIDNPGNKMSLFLWDFRGLDLLFQTIVLFTTAISCLVLLREVKN